MSVENIVDERIRSAVQTSWLGAWLANLNPSQPLPLCQEATDCTLYCIQFIADVHQLHKGGYISKSLWMLWEREIKRTLTGPVFRWEWDGVAAEFAYNRDFLRYIEELMRPGLRDR